MTEPRGYVIRTEHGAYCSVCQSPLSIEEDDFDTCDTCGGEGFPEDPEADWRDPPETVRALAEKEP